VTVPPSEPVQPDPRPGVPQPRIGDAERDRAVGFLQEHMAQGRLDADEFDDRLTHALQARTAADLRPLFDDLPEPRPAGLVPLMPTPATPWSGGGASALPVPATSEAPVPATRDDDDMPRAAKLLMAAVWPAAILISFATDWRFWWIWIAAAMVTYFVRQGFGGGGDHDRHHRRRDGEPPSLER